MEKEETINEFFFFFFLVGGVGGRRRGMHGVCLLTKKEKRKSGGVGMSINRFIHGVYVSNEPNKGENTFINTKHKHKRLVCLTISLT